MANDDGSDHRGWYGCITGTTPFFGLGGGFCADLDGNVYLQGAIGTPGFSASIGKASNLNDYLTGPSVSLRGPGKIDFGGNATSGAAGVGFGTPGFSATYGLPPFNIHDVPSYIGRLPTLLYPRGPFQETYPMP